MASELERRPPASAEEMRQAIARTRVELNESLRELRQDVVQRVDWRRPVRERPVRFVLGAFALGFILAWNPRRSA